MLLWLYWEYGTIILVILRAPTVSNMDCVAPRLHWELAKAQLRCCRGVAPGGPEEDQRASRGSPRAQYPQTKEYTLDDIDIDIDVDIDIHI